eukprot:NODE_333_length_10741_cov_0.423135.p7 type:complete len:160 gc:universal NODE_333_length_10741_cov_0.423135:6607-6128(-)
MIAILFLNSFKLKSLILCSSSLIAPLNPSTILNNELMIVLLPAPVLPTTPTFSPALTSKEIPLRIGSAFSSYFSQKSLYSILPVNSTPLSILFLLSSRLSASSPLLVPSSGLALSLINMKDCPACSPNKPSLNPLTVHCRNTKSCKALLNANPKLLGST